MQHFTSLADVPNPEYLLKQAQEAKQNPKAHSLMGKGKSICMIFLNPSLRTRLSTQKAAMNLGIEAIVLDMNQGSWKLEFMDGQVMDADKAEHVKEAAEVISQYHDIIGIRSFPLLENAEEDYSEMVINQFKKYSHIPVINLESPVRHPLQSLTDWLTIETLRQKERPKVVLTWAPHPKKLPQAVPNSFLEWMKMADMDLVLTHPQGYELHESFTEGVKYTDDQNAALEGADFVYAKNWSSYSQYGKNPLGLEAKNWTITGEKMSLTREAKFMHCLPVRRNVVVSDEVLDSEQSAIIQQAANRVPAAQAVMKALLENRV